MKKILFRTSYIFYPYFGELSGLMLQMVETPVSGPSNNKHNVLFCDFICLTKSEEIT